MMRRISVLFAIIWALMPVAASAQNITGGFDHEKFRIAVMGPESGRNYAVLNYKTGSAAGAYQFIPSTLGELGYTYSSNGSWKWNNVGWTSRSQGMGVSTLDDFRYTPSGRRLQDRAFDEFTNRNWTALSGTAKGAIGRAVHGVVVTEGGLLSAAHFLGAGGMNNFAANGFNGSNLNNLSAILRQNGFADVARLNRYVMSRIASGAAANGGVAGASGYTGTTGTNYTAEGVASGGTAAPIVVGTCMTGNVLSQSGVAVTSPYGMDRTGRASAGYHQGLDLVNNVGSGDPILAGVSGRVIVAGSGSGGNNRVVIETSDGSMRFVFMHLSSIHRDVRVVGATVQPDTQVGTMGASGLPSNAVHLHLSALMSGSKLQSAGVESRVWPSSSGWVGTKSQQPLSADQVLSAAPESFYFVNPEPFLPFRVPFRSNLLTAYADQGLVRPDGLTLPNNCSINGGENRLSSGGGVGEEGLMSNNMANVGYHADMAMAELRDAFLDLAKISADEFSNSLQESRTADRPVAALGLLIVEE